MNSNEKDLSNFYQIIYYGTIGLATLGIGTYFFFRGKNKKEENILKEEHKKGEDVLEKEKDNQPNHKEEPKKEAEILEKEKDNQPKMIVKEKNIIKKSQKEIDKQKSHDNQKELNKEKKIIEKNYKHRNEKIYNNPLGDNKNFNITNIDLNQDNIAFEHIIEKNEIIEKSEKCPNDIQNEKTNENKNIKLRGRKNNKNKDTNKIIKKYEDIPIIIHNSEKPCISLEETSSGKIYPSKYTFQFNDENRKNDNNIEDNKIPTIPHEEEKIYDNFQEKEGKNHTKKRTSEDNKKKSPKNKKEIELKTHYKKYNEIQIIPHESEKPSFIFEEIQSGKSPQNKAIYKKNKNDSDIKLKSTNKTNSRHNEIPINEQKSEKHSPIFEEIRIRKDEQSILIQQENKNENNENHLDIKLKSINKIKKQFKEIPIIPHESEKQSFIFEEIQSGKYLQKAIFQEKTNESNENDLNLSLKNVNKIYKKYKEIPISPHESEKPSYSFEEINSTKNYSIMDTKTENKKGFSNNKEKGLKLKQKKIYNEIPIIAHESEGPSYSFEEIQSGKYYSLIKAIGENKKEFFDNKERELNFKNKNNKKYNEIPIIAHESENPKVVFEENNSGKKYNNIQTSISDFNKEIIKNIIKNQQNSSIKTHETEMPSIVYEQNNSGKVYSNIQTSFTDYRGLKQLKYKENNKHKEKTIKIYESEKP